MKQKMMQDPKMRQHMEMIKNNPEYAPSAAVIPLAARISQPPWRLVLSAFKIICWMWDLDTARLPDTSLLPPLRASFLSLETSFPSVAQRAPDSLNARI